ncbi:unnamed protein product [Phaedon cochleariae]|uniref:Ionotropic receptor n=1 Tax=Phaedon cochleariae TaxID=80249 RepID=A0A9N9SJ20_PHACE|nr:unnamed protein product [Phaedon cochleariae]
MDRSTCHIDNELQNSPNNGANDLVTTLIRNVPRHKLISTEKFVLKHQTIEQTTSSRVTIQSDNQEKITAASFKENFEKMHLFSDPRDLYLYLAWDEQLFLNFLTDPNLALPKSRGLYLIFFMYEQTNDCEGFREKTAELLAHLWETHSVLNVVANTPCTCHSDHYYTYDPFTKVADRKWGAVKVKRAERILAEKYTVTNKLRNMNRMPLKVSLFERIPTLLLNKLQKNPCPDEAIQKKPKGMYGLDAAVLKTLSKFMNFTIEIDKDKVYFGNVLDNGTVTGSLGKLMRKEVEWAANSRFSYVPHYDEIEYTNPIANDEICIVVPKSSRVPHWMAIFECFKIEVQACILITSLVCILFWYLYKKLVVVRNRHDSSRAWLEVFSIIISTPVRIRVRTRSFFFLTALMLFNIVVTGIFQGNLIKSFSNTEYYQELNSLEDFLNSGLKVHTTFLSLFAGQNSSIFRHLQAAIVDSSVANSSSMMQAAISRNMAAVERRTDAEFFIKNCFTDSNGIPLLHLVGECPSKFFLGYPLRKRSPFTPMFKSVLDKLSRGGFIDKWGEVALESLTTHSKIGEDGTQRKLELSDFQVAFNILLGGYVLSCHFLASSSSYSQQQRCQLAAVERRTDADFFIKNCFTDSNGIHLLHVVEECPNKFFLDYPLRKKSPFTPMFRSILDKLSRGGFIDKWGEVAVETLTTHSKIREDGTPRKLELSDFQVDFNILLGGYVLSCMVFTFERYWFTRFSFLAMKERPLLP